MKKFSVNSTAFASAMLLGAASHIALRTQDIQASYEALKRPV